jgi:hypothetical protein
MRIIYLGSSWTVLVCRAELESSWESSGLVWFTEDSAATSDFSAI